MSKKTPIKKSANIADVNKLIQHLRLERGGGHVIWASCTKTVISWLIFKISKHMIHKKNSLFPGLLNDVRCHDISEGSVNGTRYEC